ncbi:MAG: phage head closure protein [Pirellulaceae bacterium]|nr:phage head closure protein [Pirellulaceae bacterium]
MLPSGRLRERITIQSASWARDAAGQPIPTWTNLATIVPAEVLAANGGETVRGRQVHAEANYVIVVRYRSDVTVEHRVLWNGLYLQIVWTGDPWGDRRTTRIEARGIT